VAKSKSASGSEQSAPARWIELADRPSLQVRGEVTRFPVGRIWCVGRNYAAHAREMERDPERRKNLDPPFFFSKPSTALVPGGGSVPYPPRTHLLHHEVELAVALGRGGRAVAAEQALLLVFGYGVGLDLTRRDVQAEAKSRGRPWSLAKGFDASAPCSFLVPGTRIGHPSRGRITATVNGEVRQDGDLSEQIWTVPQLIAELSKEIELLPGDLLFTGTPAGVGPLLVGDRVEATIEGIASLTVEITAPA
jgi:fumarylpyruvate hydrolase